VYSKYKEGIIIALVTIIWFEGISFSQEIDYSRIFTSDWEKAQVFVTGNETWMKQLSARYNVSYPLAVAIIFPELIRYSALRDKIEITLLKTLYINLGEEYADFSIGQFQMKPSFAESLHQKIPLLESKLKKQFKEKTTKDKVRKYRELIVEDLEKPETQFLYLIAFMKICEIVYNLDDLKGIYRLKFLATAYNYSFMESFKQVNEMAGRKFFNTKLFRTENYSYSDISAYWYENFIANSQSVKE